ncbi:MAG: recombination mediator RecR [Bacilli bacterium]|nr:recombination mediator RecR [Mollicutes bacterium]MDY3899306.1 recombination mediator RecR [Bacilli bacterium]
MDDFKFLENLSTCFEKLPSVGKKTASRYAFHVIENMSSDEVERFARVLLETKKQVKKCKICGMYTLEDTCEICSNLYRSHEQIMVVKDAKDALAIEKTGQYNGMYHILGGLISPLDGVGPNQLNIEQLEQRITQETKEIIIATSFTMNGETTALYLEKILARDGLTISRIGYGLPAGGDLEYVDALTLKYALEGRKNK